jgi:hypothetical protein
MLKFDKIHLVTSVSNVKSIDKSYFKETLKNGQIISLKYDNDNPFNLKIKLDEVRKELVLEFTSKILNEDFIQLISKDTIIKALNNINDLGVINLDVNKILKDSKVLNCDVTYDVKTNFDKSIYQVLLNSVSNYNYKWHLSKFGTGVVMNKNVKTKKCRERLTIYQKTNELSRKNVFLETFGIKTKNKIFDYFENITRFEINLFTIASIKDKLKIEDSQLHNVLESTANPINDLVKKLFMDFVNCDKNDKQNTATSKKNKLTYEDLFGFSKKEEMFNYLLSEKCNHNLQKIERVLRNLLSPKTNIKMILKNNYNNIVLRKFEIRNNVRMIGEKIINLTL